MFHSARPRRFMEVTVLRWDWQVCPKAWFRLRLGRWSGPGSP